MDEIELVRSLPAPAPASPTERDRIRASFATGLVQMATRPRTGSGWWRRLSRPAVLAATALFLAGMVTVVAAGVFAEWGGAGVAATEADIRAEIADMQAAIALPPGETYPDLFPHKAAETNNLAKYLGVQQVQFYAMCSWATYWLESHAANDAGGVAVATAVIAEFPTWQAIADPRLADDTIRRQIDEVVAAAAAGDREPIDGLVAAACQ
jgi:hypothetical protein